MREVAEIAERFVAARRHEGLRLSVADALHGRERIVNDERTVRIRPHLEVDARAIDRWRLDADAKPLRFVAEFRELVGVALVERHRSSDEFDRVVRLEPGCLISDQRIRRRVALVEAVVGELCQQVEDFVGHCLRDLALDCSADKALSLRVHLSLDLLAHRAAQ